MARDHPIGVECCCCCTHEFFPKTWHRCGCFWCVGGFWMFFEHWCVCGVSFFSNYLKCLGTLGFISAYIILQHETPKLPAQLWYKIHVFYMGHTYQSTKIEKKCYKFFEDQRE